MSIATNLQMFRGEAKTIVINEVDAFKKPVNITGWTLRFTMRPSEGSSVIEIQKDMNLGVYVTNVTGGIFQVVLLKADTATLPVGNHFWDVKRIDAGFEAIVANGNMLIMQEQTQ